MKYIFLIIFNCFFFIPNHKAGCENPHFNSSNIALSAPIEPIKTNKKNLKSFFYKKNYLPKKQRSQQLEDGLFKIFVGTFFLGLVIFCVAFPLNLVWLWWIGLILESFLLIMGLGLLFSSLIFSQGKGNFKIGQLLFYLSGWSGTIIWFFFKGLVILIFGLMLSTQWLWIAGAISLGLAIILGLIYIELFNLWV